MEEYRTYQRYQDLQKGKNKLWDNTARVHEGDGVTSEES